MGEPLTKPIHYQNEQWAVTGYGIEELPPSSGPIDVGQIGEKRKDAKGHVTYYNLPMHMAGKGRVNIELFLDAFMHALVIYEKECGGPASLKLFVATADAARERAKKAKSNSSTS